MIKVIKDKYESSENPEQFIGKLTKDEMAAFLTDPEVALTVVSDKMGQMDTQKQQSEIENITRCISNPGLHTKVDLLDRE